MKLYDNLRFNKYYWKIYQAQKKIRGVKRILFILGESIAVPFKHCFNIWDYMDSIERRGNVIEIKDGTKFYIPKCRIDTIQKTIARDDDYYSSGELGMIRKKIFGQEMNILDIGGNIGNHTVYFARRCKAKHVYTFEPQKDVFEILRRNVELNEINDKCTLYNVALGGGAGNAKIENYNETNSGGTSIVMDSGGDIKVMAVDDINLPEIGFVKIDVEGFEYNVLSGARNLIKKDKPIIYIEIKSENFAKIDDLLKSYGYELKENIAENYLYMA